MWRVAQFLGKILACPMLIMMPVSPESRCGYIIDYAFVCAPDFLLILPVSERKLRFCIFFHYCRLARNLVITDFRFEIKNDLG
jgi:hypothetical protein